MKFNFNLFVGNQLSEGCSLQLVGSANEKTTGVLKSQQKIMGSTYVSNLTKIFFMSSLGAPELDLINYETLVIWSPRSYNAVDV